MQNFQLGDYRGGRDTLQEAMQMQYAPLQNLAQAAQGFGQQGMAGANKLKSQAMEQAFLGNLEDVKFGHEMEKVGTEYDRRLQEQEARYGYESEIHAADQQSAAEREHAQQIDLGHREKESDNRKVKETERIREQKLGDLDQEVAGQSDFILGLYDTMAAGLDPNSEMGQFYHAQSTALRKAFTSGSPIQKAAAISLAQKMHVTEPTTTTAIGESIINAKEKQKLKKAMSEQPEPEEKDPFGLGGEHADFHWSAPKKTKTTK